MPQFKLTDNMRLRPTEDGKVFLDGLGSEEYDGEDAFTLQWDNLNHGLDVLAFVRMIEGHYGYINLENWLPVNTTGCCIPNELGEYYGSVYDA